MTEREMYDLIKANAAPFYITQGNTTLEWTCEKSARFELFAVQAALLCVTPTQDNEAVLAEVEKICDAARVWLKDGYNAGNYPVKNSKLQDVAAALEKQHEGELGVGVRCLATAAIDLAAGIYLCLDDPQPVTSDEQVCEYLLQIGRKQAAARLDELLRAYAMLLLKEGR